MSMQEQTSAATAKSANVASEVMKPSPDGADGAQHDASADTAMEAQDAVEVEEPGPVSDGAEVAAQPTTRIVDDTIQTETFIPVTRFALIEKLSAPELWREGEGTAIRDFFSCLGAIRNLTYTTHLMNLKEAYLPFSPDRDTVRALEYSPDELATMQDRLTRLLARCLEGANYKLITAPMLEEIFEEKSAYGLDLQVDLTEFDEVMIFSRGSTVKAHHYRSWKSLFLRKHVESVPIFQRLFLLLKLKPEDARVREIMLKEDITEAAARKRVKKLRRMLPEQASSDFIYLKMFKQIPRADLQMMFPNTRVRFRLKDKLFLGVTAGGGTIASIISAAGKIALVVTNPVKAIGALVGLSAVVFRQVKKFFAQKNQYMMTLAQNLYFHNLADNRGVLTLLVDRAEEEDVKEEMLLYALLARGPLARADLDEAREAIEQFLWEDFSVRITFDIEDALGRLLIEGLVHETAAGVLETLEPRDAIDRLRETWSAHLDLSDRPVNTSEAAAA